LARGTARDDVDSPAERVGAEERRPCPQQHLDSFDVVQRDREIAVVMPGLGIVDADAVEQYQRLAETSATDREVRLHVWATCAHVHAGRESQDVFNRPDRQPGHVVASEHPHGPPDAIEGHRLRGAADHDRFVNAGRLSRYRHDERCRQSDRQKERASHHRAF